MMDKRIKMHNEQMIISNNSRVNQLKKWEGLFCTNNTPIQKLSRFLDVEVWVKRDDLNHPVVQGNKLRKLKYNIEHAINNRKSCLVTFGGAWSNHILATACASQACGLKSIGFIRGDELGNNPQLWSKTLIRAQNFGMKLVFLNRHEYRKKNNSKVVKQAIDKMEGHIHLVPEGGTNSLAALGVSEIVLEIQQQCPGATHIVTACGTGGTIAGLVHGVAAGRVDTHVIGIPVLKNWSFLEKDIEKLIPKNNHSNWRLYDNYHFGGYAKQNQKLNHFGTRFVSETNIDLDKIYTIKSFYAAYDLIEKGSIPANSCLVILHTGGMQGGSINQE